MGLLLPDYGLLFWMLLSFSIVLFILRKFAWKPILKVLKDRDETIAKSIDSAKQAKEEMERLHEDNKKILAEARRERDKLLKNATDTKNKIIRQAEEEAKTKANQIMQDTHLEIENQKQKIISEIKKEVAELSINIAEKIIKKELQPENKQKMYINELIDEIQLN